MDLETQAMNAYDTVVATVTTYGMSVVAAIVILIVGWIASSWIGKGVDRALGRVKGCDITLRHFLSSLAKYTVIAVAAVMVLEKFGVQTASLIAVLGAAGLAIGLALQGTLQNVAAGVMLLAFRPFKVGDYIVAGGLSGTVKHISLFVTELSTPDNVQVIAPNAELWNKPITNYSVNPTRRQDFPVGIAYEDDVDKALAILKRLAEAEPRILKDPAPEVMVTGLGESAVDLQLRAWMAAGDYWALKWDMTRAIKRALDAEGITIPYPQRVVHHLRTDVAAE